MTNKEQKQQITLHVYHLQTIYSICLYSWQITLLYVIFQMMNLKNVQKTDYYNMMNNYFISKLHKYEWEKIIWQTIEKQDLLP